MKNILWNFFKKLANLNFAIGILFLISLFSIIGSIIEQDQNLLYYQTYYPISKSLQLIFLNWQVIIFLGFDHVYRTWWFMIIILLFILSLIMCTLSTQLPSLRNARRWKFISYSKSKSSLSKLSLLNIHNNISDDYSFINIIYSLVNTNFFVFCQNQSIYAYKGLYGRIAPVFVHISIILIIFGSMLSFLFGFVIQEMIPDGELFHFTNIISAGFYSYLPTNILGRVENFYIDYNIDHSIKQFFSKLSIFSGTRKSINSYLISVNSPLIFKGISFYQTDWKVNALRLQLNSKVIIQKNLSKIDINGQNCWMSILDKDKKVFFLIFNLKENILICDFSGSIIGSIAIGEKFYFNNTLFTIKDIICSTGLQIKMDLGLKIVYLGFFILMLTTTISYLSYSQIWAYLSWDSIQFLGSTNRAILFFQEDIAFIKMVYNFYFNNYRSYTIYTLIKTLK
uniref:Cytochrome c biogenesis protein Ccs1 n=1 Tax=Lophocladia kuetzingii TaxID=675577 RepID=A0A1Z1MN91_9FLOR|nr:cytochrome c biogenesis protein ccs1 [Lophocladia kuetzingii]ARW67570.1 cytochrome c biogenesis protein ccs1 [Lophocladia kuetzingii]